MSEKENQEIIEVGPIDPSKETSPISEGPEPEEAVTSRKVCKYNGTDYSTCSYVSSPAGLLHCVGSVWYLKK